MAPRGTVAVVMQASSAALLLVLLGTAVVTARPDPRCSGALSALGLCSRRERLYPDSNRHPLFDNARTPRIYFDSNRHPLLGNARIPRAYIDWNRNGLFDKARSQHPLQGTQLVLPSQGGDHSWSSLVSSLRDLSRQRSGVNFPRRPSQSDQGVDDVTNTAVSCSGSSTCKRRKTQPQLACRDQDGQPVDWYVLYKLPKNADVGTEKTSGHEYLHFSSASTTAQWQLSDVTIEHVLSMPSRTLAPVYVNPTRNTLRYVFFNDQRPDGTTCGTEGHTKGVLAFEEGDQGFWLVHSVPRFPQPPGQQYTYPDNGVRHGQSFLCITIPANEVDTVIRQIDTNEPCVYASNVQLPKSTATHTVETVQGHVSFAKSRRLAEDLYSFLVAPRLETSLDTQTWLGGNVHRLPSFCTGQYKVQNVMTMNIQASTPSQIWFHYSFRTSKDHSKWAVSQDPQKPWVCIGDINRVESQKRRGGGTVCINNSNLWSVYSHMVNEKEPCANWQSDINSEL